MSAETRTSPLRLDIEARATLSLAMVENSIPLISRIAVTNIGDEPLANLTVEISLPEFSTPWTAHISAILPGDTFGLGDIELALDRTKLVNQTERSAAELMVQVRSGDESSIASVRQRVDVLAYNEWVRGTLPQLLAAFVLPNHPVIAELLGQARVPLEELTGSPARVRADGDRVRPRPC